MEPAPVPPAPQKAGCMVGLFYVDAENVHLGTPGATATSEVLLTPDALRVTGATSGEWPWSEVTALKVLGAPARSAGLRWAGRAVTVAAAALDLWVPGSPEAMTVQIGTRGGADVEALVQSGAASAYTRREVDLSHALLSRFVAGAASPAVLSRWWEARDTTGLLRSRERETVLEEWLAEP
ncbi:hypothetical protein [Streptomyces sp. NPDC007172]|uniref:hypothetical protein n=1 Tax=Streptomyces sp. NPDC007172 TaxID=3364776 RepID=UPI00369CEE31